MSRQLVVDTNAGIQTESLSVCPICSSPQCEYLFTSRDCLYGLPGEFDLSRCQECEAVYLSERPAAESIPFYYPDNSYYSYKRPAPYALFRRKDAISSAWYYIKKSILSHQYEYRHLGGSKVIPLLTRLPIIRTVHDRATYELGVLLHPYVEEGSLLEVGCGSGMYLDLMKALGWRRTVGVDISSAAIRQAKEELGIEAYCGDLKSLGFESDSFDAVSLSHTLEHLPDPVDFLCEVRRILKPGGRLAIVVPNFESLSSRKYGENWFHLDVPRHLVNYTSRCLSVVLARAGFKIQKVTTSPRSGYSTVLHNESRKAGNDLAIHHDPTHRFGFGRRIHALLFSYIERAQCSLGMPAGEEIMAVVVKAP